MPVRVPARGTRGARIPKFSGPLKTIFLTMNVGVFRLFGRRLHVRGRPLLLLTTLGAKTSRIRQSTLAWFPDGVRSDSWLVVASYAGAAEHPAWLYNLAAHPNDAHVEIGGRSFAVRAESLEGDEYAAAWHGVVELAPSFAEYKEQTDRRIPIVRLSAISGAPG